METAEFVEILDREGRLLFLAAEAAGTDAKVPTCPQWQVRDLVRHTGMVHRWAAAFVAEGHTSYHPDGGLPDLDGDELLAWFREGHRHLVGHPLQRPARRPSAGTSCPRPRRSRSGHGGRRTRRRCTGSTRRRRGAAPRPRSPRPSRRTASTSCCAASTPAAGARSAATSPACCGCGRRTRTTRCGPYDCLRSRRWPTRDAAGDADCEVAGPAGQLYLALWNRLPFPKVTGDAAVAALWREKSAVTWS